MNTTISISPNGLKGRVLVVDDEENNRILLRDLLEAKGHRVIEARDGEEALEKAASDPPDLILLDVMMPKMDGFEACRRLKGDINTAPIPILLVTALKDRSDRLKGIEAGANDFLTKPIDIHDVILRVRNGLYTKNLYDRLEENYRRLQELERLRDSLTHMVIHDLKTPLTGISGNLQLLRMQTEKKLDGEEAEELKKSLDILYSLTRMINSMLDISRLEEGKMPLNLSSCDLRAVVREAIETLCSLKNRHRISVAAPPEPVWTFCDAEVIHRVIANLLGNAIKFTPENCEIRIDVNQEGAYARVAVTDTGTGISPEYHEKIFEKFGQAEAHQTKHRHSTGLGLTFCKLAVEAHEGKIGVESEAGKGSQFWFSLPAITEK